MRPAKIVDMEEFIRIWCRTETVQEVYEEVARIAKSKGYNPMSKPTIIAKAGNIRRLLKSRGSDLPKKKTGRPSRDLDHLAEVVAACMGQKPNGAPDPLDCIPDLLEKLGE